MRLDDEEIGGREVGAVRFEFEGDKAETARYISEARALLGNLKHRMSLAEITQLSDFVIKPDGTQIHFSSIFAPTGPGGDIDKVKIIVPPVPEVEEEAPKVGQTLLVGFIVQHFFDEPDGYLAQTEAVASVWEAEFIHIHPDKTEFNAKEASQRGWAFVNQDYFRYPQGSALFDGFPNEGTKILKWTNQTSGVKYMEALTLQYTIEESAIAQPFTYDGQFVTKQEVPPIDSGWEWQESYLDISGICGVGYPNDCVGYYTATTGVVYSRATQYRTLALFNPVFQFQVGARTTVSDSYVEPKVLYTGGWEFRPGVTITGPCGCLKTESDDPGPNAVPARLAIEHNNRVDVSGGLVASLVSATNALSAASANANLRNGTYYRRLFIPKYRSRATYGREDVAISDIYALAEKPASFFRTGGIELNSSSDGPAFIFHEAYRDILREPDEENPKEYPGNGLPFDYHGHNMLFAIPGGDESRFTYSAPIKQKLNVTDYSETLGLEFEFTIAGNTGLMSSDPEGFVPTPWPGLSPGDGGTPEFWATTFYTRMSQSQVYTGSTSNEDIE